MRKGQLDVFGIMIMIFVGGAMLVVVAGPLLSIPPNVSLMTGTLENLRSALDVADKFFLFLIIVLTAVMTYRNYYQATTTFAILINMGIVGLILVFGGQLVNAFIEITNPAVLSAVRTYMPITFYCEENAVQLLFMIGMLNLYSLFAKPETFPGDQPTYALDQGYVRY